MIQGIFYARFLPQEGTKIVAQSPPGCIVATEFTPHQKPPLVDFDIVQEYIIPRKAFFNRFVTVNTPDGEHSILGFPVSIPHERYHRNEFIFNFGLVIESDVDQVPYERLVRRFAVTFAEMERQNGYLSCEGLVDDGRRPIASLLEIVKEDLNNYGECMIPIDDANTINMKLFPYHAPPAPVHGWHVPVPKTKLAEIVDSTWDLTLQRIIPYVDGVNDVRRIAWLADVSLPLTQCALQHLLYYDTILLLDMFFFGSCYALRPGIHDFIANRANIIDECAAYTWISAPISGGGGGGPNVENMTGSTASLDIPGTNPALRRGGGAGDPLASTATLRPPQHRTETTTGTSRPSTSYSTTTTASTPPVKASHYQLIRLMTTFCVGRSTMEWVRLHQETGFDVLRHVDVRRLVQFGVVKGLLYRVHKYAVSKSYLTLLATGRRAGPAGISVEQSTATDEVKRRSTATTTSISTSTSNTAANTASSSGRKITGDDDGGGRGEKGKGKDKEMRPRRPAASVIVEAAKSPQDDGLEMKMSGRRMSSLRIHDEADKDEVDDATHKSGGGRGTVDENNDNDSSGDEEDDDNDDDKEDDGNGRGNSSRAAGKTRRKMLRYLDGRHCFDQIITEQNLTDADILRKLKHFEAGDLAIMYH